MTTCAQQWETADIRKRKPAGRLNEENNQQDCGAPSPPGEDWISLNPPMLSTDKNVTGATPDMLRKKSWQKCHSC